MNLSIAKEQLLAGLQSVQNIVSTRTTLPVLSNVLLRAEGDRLSLTATDLDVTIACSVAAAVKRPGSTTAPVKKLVSIARELGSSDIELDTDDKNVTSIRSGASHFRVRGLGPEEFPSMPRFQDDRKVELGQEKLRAMLKRTSFATSSDESRYVLNGIFFSLHDQRLTLVATDGRRLAMAEEDAEVGERSQGDFIVPSKAVIELGRLLQEKGSVKILVGENQASFALEDEKGGSITIITKLIEGNYPNYRQVIPGEPKERIALSREDLMHALRRAEIMTSEKQNSVKLSFSKNNLAISANAPDIGEAQESLAINYKGVDLAVAFNPGYLIDPLTALTNDEVFLELIDELSPGVLKINGPFLYVVMPMRLT
ncbi:MAG: DNA polymerase III subunit beta [Verrucomicrobia bacterium]|nr:DNA polymerase III subunit beta [Verrucomicrobiota bacterium]MBI3868792.1 DNA polymerase III subunit beta [Verrucomicrobiota bacterium]